MGGVGIAGGMEPPLPPPQAPSNKLNAAPPVRK
jgi:hypothetical protein